MNTCRVMIDIETYSTQPDAVILSIGAVAMDKMSTHPFYVEVNPDQPLRHTCPKTVEFWKTQNIVPPLSGTTRLMTALYRLKGWFIYYNFTEIWANGSHFDIPILEHAYRQFDLPVPWKYNAVRDYRTLKSLLPHIAAEDTGGTKHNALDDAVYQAAHCNDLLKELNRCTTNTSSTSFWPFRRKSNTTQTSN